MVRLATDVLTRDLPSLTPVRAGPGRTGPQDPLSAPQVAAAAPRALQHPRADPLLPPSCPGGAGGAPEGHRPLPPRWWPGSCVRGAEAPAVGGSKPALAAEAELPASGAQVCAAHSAGQSSADGLLLPL